MIYLLETAVGYAMFSKANDSGDVELLETYGFSNVDEAVESAFQLVKGEVPPNLESFIRSTEVKCRETLVVNDQKLVEPLEGKLSRKVVYSNDEIQRSMRRDVHKYFGLSESEYSTRVLCLSHKMSMGKVKLVPERIDTMVIQSVSLLEDMDKDINLHSMRLKEWYGLHFPELLSVSDDNREYLSLVVALGRKEEIDDEKRRMLREIIGERFEKVMKLAETSMGVEMSEDDVGKMIEDARSVIRSFKFRDELLEYVRVKMEGLAPNLMALVGEVIGARMISKARSLSNLAKMPGSTIQMMGAEKALFQALRSKSNTPKYGMIYGCSLVGQASPQYKGKISRALASKIGIAARIDSYGEEMSGEFGAKMRSQIEKRIKDLESRSNASKKVVRRPKHEVKPSFYDDSKDFKRIKQE